MTSTQKAKTNMYLGLLLFLNGTLNIWQVLAAFVTAFDEFKLKLQELQGQQARQEEITKGYAVQKRNALMKMADLAYKMKGALQAFAAATGNDILFGKINWSFTDLIEGASTVKKNRSQVILNFGKEEVGNLAAYSVTEADLEALEEAIENTTF
ncbi:MAG: hypothetical protein IPJ79_08190 [Bacteroidetes bacterium]|nr:hypothetical protein [Bacteroidota bacterium]